MGNLLVTILFGWLGVHKFMEKKTGLGIAYLLTLGLFGIGWLVDIVIAINKLKKTSVSNQSDSSNSNSHLLQNDSSTYDDNDEEEPEADSNRINFNVAGVTFNNDDGTSRQSILKNFYQSKGYNKNHVEFKIYDFEGSPAVAVYAKGLMIGNVPKEYVQIIINNLDTLRIYHFRVKLNSKGIYYSIIDLFLQ